MADSQIENQIDTEEIEAQRRVAEMPDFTSRQKRLLEISQMGMAEIPLDDAITACITSIQLGNRIQMAENLDLSRAVKIEGCKLFFTVQEGGKILLLSTPDVRPFCLSVDRVFKILRKQTEESR